MKEAHNFYIRIHLFTFALLASKVSMLSLNIYVLIPFRKSSIYCGQSKFFIENWNTSLSRASSRSHSLNIFSFLNSHSCRQKGVSRCMSLCTRSCILCILQSNRWLINKFFDNGILTMFIINFTVTVLTSVLFLRDARQYRGWIQVCCAISKWTTRRGTFAS